MEENLISILRHYRCPTDGTNLTPYTLQGLEVNVCKKCGGILFDQDEFKAVLESKGLLPHHSNVPLFALPQKEERDRALPSAIVRHCPKDHHPLHTHQYDANSGIWIDKCPSCNSMWLDRKELDAIKKYLGDERQETLSRIWSTFVAEHHKIQVKTEEMKDLPLSLLAPFFSIPYADTGFSKEKFPWLNVSLIIINLLIFFIFIFSKNDEVLHLFFHEYGFVPALATSLFEIHRFITSIFLHVDLFHVGGNMLFLWIFGDNIEEKFGKATFITLYVATGVIASLAYAIPNPSSLEPAIGASGAISGLMGAYLVLFPSHKLKFFLGRKVVRVSARYYLTVFIILQIWNSYRFFEGGSEVAFLAHVGGFVTGAILAFLFIRTDYIFKRS